MEDSKKKDSIKRDKSSERMPHVDTGPAGRLAGSSLFGPSQTEPVSFSQLRQIDPKFAKSFKTRGGYKPWGEAEVLYNSMPESVRAEGPEAMKSYLSQRDASHIIAKAQGGPNTADNMRFEDSALNRQRNYNYKSGKRDTPHMMEKELQQIDAADRMVNVKATASRAVESGAKAAVVAAAVEGALSALEDGVDYRKGDIDGKEYAKRVAGKAAKGGLVGGAVGAGSVAFGAFAPLTAAALAPVAIGFAVAGALTVTYRAGKAIKKHVDMKKSDQISKPWRQTVCAV